MSWAAIRDFFSKSCTDCQHYSWHRENDKLLPDKSVIKGKMLCESCEKMNCRLNDLKACDLFQSRSRTHNSFHAMTIHTGKPWPPRPPNTGSSVERPK